MTLLTNLVKRFREWRRRRALVRYGTRLETWLELSR